MTTENQICKNCGNSWEEHDYESGKCHARDIDDDPCVCKKFTPQTPHPILKGLMGKEAEASISLDEGTYTAENQSQDVVDLTTSSSGATEDVRGATPQTAVSKHSDTLRGSNETLSGKIFYINGTWEIKKEFVGRPILEVKDVSEAVKKLKEELSKSRVRLKDYYEIIDKIFGELAK